MRTILLVTLLMLLPAATNAGIIQDQLSSNCPPALNTPPLENPCDLQNDADHGGDASDSCSAANDALPSEGTFNGTLWPLEDRADWYTWEIPSDGDWLIDLTPSANTSSLLHVRLEVKETDCSTDAEGSGTAGGATRHSATSYTITKALANQDVLIGVVSKANVTVDEDPVHVSVPLMCYPGCKLLEATLFPLIQYEGSLSEE